MYSLSNNIEESVSYLELALKNGYNNFEWLQEDPDLENLRRSNNFKVILEKYTH